MIYVSENKATLCKGDFRPAQLYKGKKKIAGYNVVPFDEERTISLENCYNDRLYSVKIYGNTLQGGDPSPENPIPMQSVGDLVTEGEYEGKYRVRVVAYNDTVYRTFDVYLDEPLRKIGKYEDYIDFENRKVIRNIGARVFNGTESWKLETLSGGTNCYMRLSDAKGDNLVTLYCNKGKYYNSGNLTNDFAIRISTSGNFNYRYPNVSSISTYKQMLADWDAEGNPLYINYALNTTREETIELHEIATLREETNYEISTSVNARISGEYKRMEE